MSDLILGDQNGLSVQEQVDKRLRAEAFAKKILEAPAGTPERWSRIFKVWYGLDPNAREDHIAACEEAAAVRASLDDKEYGLSKASRGKAYGEEVNGHVNNALVAIMPEKLKAWLVKYDPTLNKNFNKGAAEQRKAWRRVYNNFPFYRTTEKLREGF
ncbi:hypothetical protein HZA56_14015 [Candidatus Poribacteria bacterium]|nr:hypothetical protein [Candidatus Poribacteria bacterium]